MCKKQFLETKYDNSTEVSQILENVLMRTNFFARVPISDESNISASVANLIKVKTK